MEMVKEKKEGRQTEGERKKKLESRKKGIAKGKIMRI